MNKLTAIRIRNDDDTFSDQIPVSVLAENVEWDETHNLIDILGEVSINKSVQQQINDILEEIIVDDTLTIEGKAADAKAVGDMIHGLQGIVGSPLTATSTSNMTDTSKIYVHTGNGNWYYYNGSRWAVGGTYNSVAFNKDTVPVQNSSNVITSGGVYQTKIDLKEELNSGMGSAFIQTDLYNWNRRFVRYDTGEVIRQTGSGVNYTASWFAIKEGTNVSYIAGANENQAGICFYDVNGNYLSGYKSTKEQQLLTAPTGTTYAIASYRNGATIRKYCNIPQLQDSTFHNNSLISCLCEPRIIDMQEGLYVDYRNGDIKPADNFLYKVFNVSGNDVVTYKNASTEPYPGLAFFDASGNYLSGIQMKIGEIITVVPQGAVIAKVSAKISELDDFEIKHAINISNISNQVSKVPYFVLPSKDIAVVGHEWNLYFDNVINGFDPEKYCITVTISPNVDSAKVYSRFLRITPVTKHIGTKTITFSLYRKRNYELIESVDLSLIIIADTSLTGKKVLFLGDSLTAAGVYPAEIQYNLSSNGITSIGTISKTCSIGGTSYTVNVEGRGGWSATDYCTLASKSSTSNPFWDGSKFNFSYYMNNNSANIGIPDIVVVGLGTNGANNSLNDVQTIVDSIHSYNSNLMVIVSLIAPPTVQDGVGHHNNLQSADKFKDLFLQVDADYIERYENKANTDIATLYFNLDREYDFDMATIPVSSRNPTTITIQNNNVHPSEYGYLKFADSYYNRLLYYLK